MLHCASRMAIRRCRLLRSRTVFRLFENKCASLLDEDSEQINDKCYYSSILVAALVASLVGDPWSSALGARHSQRFFCRARDRSTACKRALFIKPRYRYTRGSPRTQISFRTCLILRSSPVASNTTGTVNMNSFALLQDDVEDATELSPDVPKAEEEEVVEDRPAEPVQDAHTEDVEVKEEEKKEEEDQERTRPPPKEKEMTLEEYLAKKAQLSNALTTLNSKTARKANDGAAFEKMSVLKRGGEDEFFDGVPVKEIHENKALKDSTHTAVAKNAEIQRFFKRETGDRRVGRGRGESRRGTFERGRGGTERGRGGTERGRGGLERGRGSHERGRGEFERGKGGFERGRGEFEWSRSGSERGRGGYERGRGGYERGRGSYERGRGGYERGRGGYERGRGGGENRFDGRVERDFRRDQRNGYGGGTGGSDDTYDGQKRFSDAPRDPVVPDVDDTAAFPSL